MYRDLQISGIQPDAEPIGFAAGERPFRGGREALRAATATAHARLHAVPVFGRIVAGTVSLDDYGQLLAALRLFHAAAQPRLRAGYARLDAAGIAVPARDFVALLDADLQAIGRPVPPAMRTHIVAHDPIEALGWVWAVDGSALGGQIMYRALDALFGETEAGRSYYRPYGDFGRRWRAICAGVEAEAVRPRALDRMAAGARTAFASIEDHVTRRA